MTIISANESDTIAAGVSLAKTLRPGCIVALSGGLGAGKTAFVRGIAKGLGIDAVITSPTFTIVYEYDGILPLFHFDVYRLGSEDELFDIGWDDYLSRDGVCAVEWCGIVSGAFPEDTIYTDIEFIDDNTRLITITGHGFDDGTPERNDILC